MSEMIPFGNKEVSVAQTALTTVSEELLADVRKDSELSKKTMTLPIAKLSTLGSGVSCLIPELNTITLSTTAKTEGLYRLANASVGDTLKHAKDGNFWGAFKTGEGASKLAKLTEAGPVSSTSEVVMKANPATFMMAVALFSIEKELGAIAEMEKQIISFLENEKESEIEADVTTLNSILSKYKSNWDNEHFIASNHKQVLDLQRTARKHMISYQKTVNESLKSKKLIVANGQVDSTLNDLQKKFKNYRLSLYTFSLASLTEIMLSGNFKEENISVSIEEIRKYTDEYRELFGECSVFLENLSGGSIGRNMIKGLGVVSNGIGKLLGGIPKVRDTQVDEFFQGKGESFKEKAQDISKEVVMEFAEVSNPNTGTLIQKMEDLICIYNKTTDIRFDKENIYLIA